MNRALALGLAVVGLLWTRALANGTASSPTGAAMVLGFTLLGAWLAGAVLKRLRLPQLTGHLMFGVLVGPYLANLITTEMAGQLTFINGIATTLMALMAGLALNVDRLGNRLRPIAKTTAFTLAVPLLGLTLLGWLSWGWLPIAPYLSGWPRVVASLVTAVVVVTFSPTMTAAVLADAGGRNRLGELVLTMVVLADLALLVIFAASTLLARAVFTVDGATTAAAFLFQIVWEVGGAIAFGALVGSVFALYLRYVGQEVPLVLLAVSAVLSQVGSSQQLQPLLAAVTAGFVVENLSARQGDAIRVAIRNGGQPVLIMFFVAVGASLRLEATASIAMTAIGVAILRLSFVWAGVRLGARASGLEDGARGLVWTGLISQAGITLGFAAIVAQQFPTWGPQVQVLAVALLAVHELAGPLAFRRALAHVDGAATEERPVVVVSNREPYLHDRSETGDIRVSTATGGVAVALDALMRERGGVWIAHGAGSADRATVDPHDKVRVPPESPAYDLRRLWIEDSAFAGYYGGFANEGLWPLCHVVDVRPQFRTDDWLAYEHVNQQFARAVHDELGTRSSPVFIQDYHLARVAPFLRDLRPATRTALFWHIPWPYPDRLRICPWRRELLQGLLANDLVAFQLERDRRNFLMAVEEELGADIEEDTSRVYIDGRYSAVISVPIGVDYDRIQRMAADPSLVDETERLRSRFGLTAPIVGLGVDRLDYTKGIPERLQAIDALVTERPWLRGRFTFVQIGVPSRSSIDRYAAIEHEITSTVAAINLRHAVPGGAPLVTLSTSALSAFSLTALYRMAHFCVVSSLHDGMNLVAKEFVAARDDERGVLVLSEMAGAAQELADAVSINPYDIDAFTRALAVAVDMPEPEQQRRMRAMRKVVAGRDVFRWASDILEGLESLWTKPLLYSVRGWDDAAI